MREETALRLARAQGAAGDFPRSDKDPGQSTSGFVALSAMVVGRHEGDSSNADAGGGQSPETPRIPQPDEPLREVEFPRDRA